MDETSCAFVSRVMPSDSGAGRPAELGGRELDNVLAADIGGGIADISATEPNGGGPLESGYVYEK